MNEYNNVNTSESEKWRELREEFDKLIKMINCSHRFAIYFDGPVCKMGCLKCDYTKVIDKAIVENDPALFYDYLDDTCKR